MVKIKKINEARLTPHRPLIAAIVGFAASFFSYSSFRGWFEKFRVCVCGIGSSARDKNTTPGTTKQHPERNISRVSEVCHTRVLPRRDHWRTGPAGWELSEASLGVDLWEGKFFSFVLHQFITAVVRCWCCGWQCVLYFLTDSSVVWGWSSSTLLQIGSG